MKILVSALVVLITLSSVQGLAFRRLFCQLGVTQLCQNQRPITVVRVPAAATGATAANNNGFANVPAILNAANQALNNAAGAGGAGAGVGAGGAGVGAGGAGVGAGGAGVGAGGAGVGAGGAGVAAGGAGAGVAQPAQPAQPAAGAANNAAVAPPAAGRDAQLVYNYDPYAQYVSYGDDEYEDYEGARQRQRQRRRPNVQVINTNRRGNRRNRGNRRGGVNVVRG